jgi:hypothetical protein
MTLESIGRRGVLHVAAATALASSLSRRAHAADAWPTAG